MAEPLPPRMRREGCARHRRRPAANEVRGSAERARDHPTAESDSCSEGLQLDQAQGTCVDRTGKRRRSTRRTPVAGRWLYSHDPWRGLRCRVSSKPGTPSALSVQRRFRQGNRRRLSRAPRQPISALPSHKRPINLRFDHLSQNCRTRIDSAARGIRATGRSSRPHRPTTRPEPTSPPSAPHLRESPANPYSSNHRTAADCAAHPAHARV